MLKNMETTWGRVIAASARSGGRALVASQVPFSSRPPMTRAPCEVFRTEKDTNRIDAGRRLGSVVRGSDGPV